MTLQEQINYAVSQSRPFLLLTVDTDDSTGADVIVARWFGSEAECRARVRNHSALYKLEGSVYQQVEEFNRYW